jgi:uncharacterized protein (TIGR02284 family)
MAHDQDRAVRALNDLIATCHDSEEGYAKAAKGVHNDQLSNRLTSISGRRGQMANELRNVVSGLGAAAATDAHFGGILHRGWVDLETRLRGKSDNEIVQECVDGDAGTLQHYDHALDQALSADARTTVERQRSEVREQITSLQARHGKTGTA